MFNGQKADLVQVTTPRVRMLTLMLVVSRSWMTTEGSVVCFSSMFSARPPTINSETMVTMAHAAIKERIPPHMFLLA